MPRIRTIKPELFDDPDVGSLSAAARWLFVGLLTQADRRGRLIEDHRRIKVRLCAFDDSDVAALLDEISRARLIIRYSADDCKCIQIRTFEKHQRPHPKEPASTIPDQPVTTSREKKRRAVKRNDEPVSSRVDSGSLDTGSLDKGNGEREGKEYPPPAVARSSHGVWTQPKPRSGLVSSHHDCASHVAGMCVPPKLHEKLKRLCRGMTDIEADKAVSAFYAVVDADPRWAATVPAADVFKFLSDRWEEHHGGAPKKTAKELAEERAWSQV